MNLDDELYRSLPNTLSTEAANQLLQYLYALAGAIENRYADQLYQHPQSSAYNDDQLPLWDRDPPF
jgi:hypothetical protein